MKQQREIANDHSYLSIELSRKILKPLGAWPVSPKASKSDKLGHILTNVVICALMAFVFVPSSWYLLQETENVYNSVRVAGPVSFCIMAILKYASLMLRENDVRRCVEYVKADWRYIQHADDQRIMIENAYFGRRLVKISSFFMIGSAVFYYVFLPIVGGKTVAPDDANLTYFILPYPIAKSIVDARYSPVNELVIIGQFIYGLAVHSITAGSCSLVAVFAMHAYGQLEILMSWLEHLVDGREDLSENINGRLASIINLHVRTLNFVSFTEELMHEISLVEMVGCTLNICTVGYCCLMEWKNGKMIGHMTFIVLLISMTFNIFIYCYIGELLTEQCKKVGEKSYMIEWHRLPKEDSRGLILVIAMSRSSKKLTAGNLMELSMSSFSDVIKSSMAYVNMLRELT